jgi:hypothetical protein
MVNGLREFPFQTRVVPLLDFFPASEVRAFCHFPETTSFGSCFGCALASVGRMWQGVEIDGFAERVLTAGFLARPRRPVQGGRGFRRFSFPHFFSKKMEHPTGSRPLN